MKIKRIDKIVLTIITLGLVSLIFENAIHQGPLVVNISHGIDLLVSFLFVSLFLVDLLKAKDKLKYIRHNIFETLFIVTFAALLIYAKVHYFFISPYEAHNLPTKIILIISLFNVCKVLLRIRKLNAFFRNFTIHPAQTIIMSFLFMILVGTIVLMMPFSTADNSHLGFVNALFTSTSAVCVTGLVVVDTATRFSGIGKFIIMSLIQVGGLGIMILSSFTAFLVGKKLSFRDKLTISYMLDEEDTSRITRGVRNIILFTFLFEFAGAILLLPSFVSMEGMGRGAFYSVFHAISAFCNAGFALFTDNIEQFRSSTLVNMVIAGLIIAGGISFVVLSNSYSHVRSRFRKRFATKKFMRIEKLRLNTKVVLAVTTILIVAGTLLIYKFEHRDNLLPLDMKTQYLEAFFQSVTLRTAGFNTMDISKLHTATYALMILFMFIGGASGSTAGGIKVNTVGVIWSYIRSVFRKDEDAVLFRRSISKELINQAFLVVFLSLTVIFAGTMLLALTENRKFIRILFETVSAFGTVGLSTGITGELSEFGKITLVLMMFIGRLGPLTIITALVRKTKRYNVRYPAEKVSIG